jgi:hypothetical protein
MRILRRHFRKLIITAVLTLAVSALTIGSSASTYTIIATASDGSYAARSCGSSAGNYVVVWYAPTNTYTYFDTLPGECPPNED